MISLNGTRTVFTTARLTSGPWLKCIQRPGLRICLSVGMRLVFQGCHDSAVESFWRNCSNMWLAHRPGCINISGGRVTSWCGITAHCCTRARPYDYSEPRVLIGTRVAGDVPSELAYYPEDPRAQLGREALSAELHAQRAAAGLGG